MRAIAVALLLAGCVAPNPSAQIAAPKINIDDPGQTADMLDDGATDSGAADMTPAGDMGPSPDLMPPPDLAPYTCGSMPGQECCDLATNPVCPYGGHFLYCKPTVSSTPTCAACGQLHGPCCQLAPACQVGTCSAVTSTCE